MRLMLAGARAPFLALGLILLSSCGGTPSEPGPKSGFENFLVIGVAGNYDSRAQFERVMASQLRNKGASAAPLYSVISGNQSVVREDIIAVVQERGFDAVLAVRHLDSEVELEVTPSRSGIDATPIGGRFLNLFRSDYTNYTNPESINLSENALLAIELYSVETEDVVYKFEFQTKSESNVGLLIDHTAKTIVNRLDRQNLIAN